MDTHTFAKLQITETREHSCGWKRKEQSTTHPGTRAQSSPVAAVYLQRQDGKNLAIMASQAFIFLNW